MNTIASTPGAARLFATSIIARIPLAMLSIGLLVHVEHLTGSFAAAGIVAGAYAISLGLGGPLLGQLVDRRGQTSVLLASATASAALLGAVALLPVGTPVLLLVALATATGVATPPLGACLRTLFGGLLPDPGAVRAAYAFEASASELTWIAGPPVALAVGALWSTAPPSRGPASCCWPAPWPSPRSRRRAPGGPSPEPRGAAAARCRRRRSGRW